MISFGFFLLALSCVSAESETVKSKVTVGSKEFSCTFTLANDGAAVVLGDSKAVCTPNKPKKKTVTDFEVSTDTATYKLSFKINPEKITKASMGNLLSCSLILYVFLTLF
jgi:hypothetical protein